MRFEYRKYDKQTYEVYVLVDYNIQANREIFESIGFTYKQGSKWVTDCGLQAATRKKIAELLLNKFKEVK